MGTTGWSKAILTSLRPPLPPPFPLFLLPSLPQLAGLLLRVPIRMGPARQASGRADEDDREGLVSEGGKEKRERQREGRGGGGKTETSIQHHSHPLSPPLSLPPSLPPSGRTSSGLASCPPCSPFGRLSSWALARMLACSRW